MNQRKPPGDDAFADYDATLARASADDPWRHERGEQPVYEPDARLVEKLLSIPVAAGSAATTGRFAKGIDAWIAHELRRCGFGADEVWPRATRPRVLPRDVAVLLEHLPKKLADDVAARLPGIPAIAPSDARVLGRAYDKQVDVCLARWDRGPEILISTKSQLSSFAKNLPNRFEEAYGDAGNLRARHPLAAVGFFFVQRATVRECEPDAYERAIDMVRKLRDAGPHLGANGYTATALMLVDWDDADAPALSAVDDDGARASRRTRPGQVRVVTEGVPDDVGPAQFFTRIVDHVLAATPVQHHVEVRRRRERRPIPVVEADVRAAAPPGQPAPEPEMTAELFSLG
ncbi:MAG: hypothetical protein U0Q15_19500 [Kineosporiaceae bacterium]